MEKKSSNNILIIVLVILVIGLAFFIIYDKLLSSNNNGSIIGNDNSDLKENVLQNNDFISIFLGKYHYEEILDVVNQENGGYCKSFESFELLENGTYTYQGGETCGSGQTATGNYSIGRDKIYLFNDDCKIINMSGECNYPNCSPIFKFNYTITDNGIEIFTTSNTKLEKQ